VSESDYARKYSLLCLRMAAECRDLAAIASTMEMQARVLRMANMWEELAVQPAVEIRPDDNQADRKGLDDRLAQTQGPAPGTYDGNL
jgi:hypothetical protein